MKCTSETIEIKGCTSGLFVREKKKREREKRRNRKKSES